MVRRCLRGLLMGALVLSVPLSAAAQSGSGRFILRTKSVQVGDVTSRHGVTVAEVLRDDGQDVTVLVEGRTSTPADDLISEIRADDAVGGFEPNRDVAVSERQPRASLSQSTAAILEALSNPAPVVYFGSTVPSSFASQAAGVSLRVTDAQRYATGDVTIAVIDTGIDANHPGLRGVVLPGYDFTRDRAGVASDMADLSQSTAAILEQSTAAILEQRTVFVVNQSTAAILEQSTAAILEGLPPSFGHGTMVAGLIHYVAPTARILPLKAFHADGTAKLSDIVRAIYYAVDNGARIINMSFSATESSQELMRAVQYAVNRRVTLIASAGNEGYEAVVYPAGYRPVIAVGATTAQDRRAAFSNYGISSVSVAAPGEALVTSYPGAHWAAVSGTSFSSALISGGVALMLQAYPGLSVSQAREDLSKGAVPVTGLGEGRVDLLSAVQRVMRRR